MRRIVLLAVVMASLPAPAGAAVLARERGHQVARHLGTALWSERARDGRYFLVSRAGRLRVGPQERPFDLDVGTDSRGRLAAVYSRCLEGRRQCRIHMLDLAAEREVRLYRGHRPSLRQGVLAFARLRSDGRDAIFLRRLGIRGRERQVHVLPRTHPATTGLDLGAGGLAFTAAGRGTRLWFKAPGPRARVRMLAAGAMGRSTAQVHASPSFAGRFLYWAFSDRNPARPPNGWVLRRDVRSGATLAARAPGYLESVAADAARPTAHLITATYAGDPSRARPGDDLVATFPRPRWRAVPRGLGVRP